MNNDTPLTLKEPSKQCHQYYELITGAIDNELLPDEQVRLDAHLKACAPCTSVLEFERETKQFIQTKLPPVKTPWKVRADIMEKIRTEAGVQKESRTSFFLPWLKPTFAFGGAFAVVIVAFFLLFNKSNQTPQIAQPLNVTPNNTTPQGGNQSPEVASNTVKATPKEKKTQVPHRKQSNMLNESMTDFDLFLQGKKKPQKFSSRSDEVQQYLASNVDFPVRLPEMNDCKLIGGEVKILEEGKIAQAVYTHNGHTITLYQTPLSSIDEGGPFFLPESIRTKLSEGSWYMDNSNPNCAVTMWIDNDVLFYTVGAGDKQGFMKELSNGFKSVSGHK